MPQIGSAWFFGARFDLAFAEIKKGNFRAPRPNEAHKVLESHVRDEL